jgi:predicted nucleic acid-binding protein
MGKIVFSDINIFSGINLLDEFEVIIIDSCILIKILKQEKGYEFVADLIENLSYTGKLYMNQINIYEVRYILKSHLIDMPIDKIIDEFIIDFNINIYGILSIDYIVASDIKASGGLSPYDTFALAQIQNSKKKSILLTLDKEYDKPKFTEKFDICIL